MRRLSPLEAFLAGAIPTLVACVVAVELTKPEPKELREAPAVLEQASEWPNAIELPVPELVERLRPSDAEAMPAAAAELVAEEEPLMPAPIESPDAATAEPEPEAELGAEDAAIEPEPESEPLEPAAEQAAVGPTCGPVTCPAGFACCNASCGICTLPGERCSQYACGMPMTAEAVSCGPATCAFGQICCDPQCGKCISPGQPCTRESCLSPVVIPSSEICGMALCNVGMVCCNPSCGICKPPGEPCSHRPCT